ncbi:MAG: hypothetical protein J0I44_10315, partial [Microbacterium sp.]|nr:hypothetical protein [Microbacterium sp.]
MPSDDIGDAPSSFWQTDAGLLSPVSIGTADEASDRSVVHAMIDAELALLRAFAAQGLAPRSVLRAAGAVLREP